MMNEKEKKKSKKKKGYSLIEALVALGILLLGIVPVVTVATQAILFHHRASETEEAARISQTMIDFIKSKGYDELGLIVEDVEFPKQYSISTTGTAFTVDNFANDFDISSDMVLLNSKGINLSDVGFYIDIKTTKGNLKDYKEDSDSYINPITGVTTSNVYREDLIYGKFIFGFGDTTTDIDKKTGRKTEMKTTFIITPIENWK